MITKLTRRKFIALLGVNAAALSATLRQVSAQIQADLQTLDVAVIGAGAAGLTAGYLLDQAGARFQIFEAADIHGGRARKDTTLADFPLDMGGEWIHTTNRVLNTLSQTNSAAQRAVEWRPMTCDVVSGDRLLRQNRYAREWRGEHRFSSTTWFDFFNDYMARDIQDRIALKTEVTGIDYSGDPVRVHLADGRTVLARHVIVTVPLNVLKDGDIRFDPPLPRRKQRALEGAIMPDGFKLFMRFNERFYPDMVLYDYQYETAESEIMFYNASIDKPTNQNILGLFAHGALAAPYASLSEDRLLAAALDELDELYDGAASRSFEAHVLQNWSKSRYHRGTYSYFHGSRPSTLGEPIDGRVHFAGEAYNQRLDGEWGYMHVAARSAYDAIKQISRS
ncbi:MAG: NAD(P)/FAD-dependent oxidoreductase [Pseudomonadota bacterium]